MPESVQIVLGLVFLVGVFILTRLGIMWKLRQSAESLIRELEVNGAVTDSSAIRLPYSEQNPLRIGLRDYKSKALEYLVSEGVVGKTDDGKYYLLITRDSVKRV